MIQQAFHRCYSTWYIRSLHEDIGKTLSPRFLPIYQGATVIVGETIASRNSMSLTYRLPCRGVPSSGAGYPPYHGISQETTVIGCKERIPNTLRYKTGSTGNMSRGKNGINFALSTLCKATERYTKHTKQKQHCTGTTVHKNRKHKH